MKKLNMIKIILSLIGVLFIGIAVGLLRVADLGTDSFTTFNLGLSGYFDIQFGTYMIISNVIGLVLVFLTSRKLIGVGTVFNIVLVGYASDFIVHVVSTYLGTPSTLWLRLFVSVLGIVVLAIGAAAYIVADRGVAPYDALPIIVEDKSNGNISFRVARIISDILCIAIGFMFGATVGITTIVAGFCMGPLIQYFRTQLGRLLENYEEAQTETGNADS